ncbi:MAG: precorrin-3B C(17)-methyltransferase, partial [Cyanobacteria bacterium RU_5_0]|nr:precorrin-3B C(17)-methyltransferase [Cyanobacteria bacterium RU_5_0]
MGTSLQVFQPLAIITTTPIGVTRLQPVWELGGATLWLPESIAHSIQPSTLKTQSVQVYQGSLQAHLASIWSEYRGFAFCLATGAVVRLIAPLLNDKASDPAIVVVDSNGQFVISLCGGHQGGADRLARTIALQLGATPILTGSANGLGLPAIDTLGTPFGWTRGTGDWTGVSAAIARQEPVQVIQETGSTLWHDHLPAGHPFIATDFVTNGTNEADIPSPHPPIP